MKNLNIDNTWTLFLDRDGVINQKIDNGYVTKIDEFIFLPQAKVALEQLAQLFGRIVIVTNQQCIGKGIIQHTDLEKVHDWMQAEITEANGRIDRIYYAPYLVAENHPFRKPNTGMALAAQQDFPEIDFTKSILVGDSESDIELGINVGMQTVKIQPEKSLLTKANFIVTSLHEFAQQLTT